MEISGAGPTLALLHGFTGAASSWASIISRLAGAYQLIAFDLLGHGASASPADAASYRMESQAADIAGLLDQLAVRDAHLLGYSMGGRLALYLALRYPALFRSLILESASPGIDNETERAERRRRDEALADAIEAGGIDAFVQTWESLSLWETQSEALIREQRSQRAANDPVGLANCLRGMGAGAQPNLWPQLTNLRLPTCLIVGERDQKYRRINAAMAAAITGSRLEIVAGAGHNVHLENPRAFCQCLRSFLVSV